MANKRTQKRKATNAKLSKAKGKVSKAKGKMVKKAKAKLSNSKSKISKSKDRLSDKVGSMSNEKRLLKDIGEEFRPLTNMLDAGVLKLNAELDKKGQRPTKRKGTAKAKKKHSR